MGLTQLAAVEFYKGNPSRRAAGCHSYPKDQNNLNNSQTYRGQEFGWEETQTWQGILPRIFPTGLRSVKLPISRPRLSCGYEVTCSLVIRLYRDRIRLVKILLLRKADRAVRHAIKPDVLLTA